MRNIRVNLSPRLKQHIDERSDAMRKDLTGKMAENHKALLAKYSELEVRFEQSLVIEGVNGHEPRKLKDVVRDSHTSIKCIEETIQPIKDFSKWHNFNKKYKLYKILIPGITATGIGTLVYLILRVIEFINGKL